MIHHNRYELSERIGLSRFSKTTRVDHHTEYCPTHSDSSMQRSCIRSVETCCHYRTFSSSTPLNARRTKSKLALPVPSGALPKVIVPENHALWGFFRDKKSLTPPETDKKHGRPWTAEELRKKSFEDLHALWILCLMERNILATQRHERRRQQIPSEGKTEAVERDRTVKRTMAGIKFVLNERFLAYQDAIVLAKTDGTIDLESEELERKPDTNVVVKVSKGVQESKSSGMAKKAEQVFKIKAAQIAKARQSVSAA